MTIDLARELLRQRRVTEAFSALSTLGDNGDVDAMMQLAVWHLGGASGRRDVAAGRRALRKAVEVGHVDGALMEAALTANGNGNLDRPDWKCAVQLLERAALNDPVADAQRKLLTKMALANDGTPLKLPAPEMLHQTGQIHRYRSFLTRDECGHVASCGATLLEPSVVLDPQTGRPKPHPIRTSDSGAIGPLREDLVVRAVNLRIAAASRTQVSQGEPLTLLRYQPGQEYRAHLDTIAGASNQRIRTVLIYLNEGFSGGETRFPELDLTITPRGGDAVIFDTLVSDGTPDPRMAHLGSPVTEGTKWVATRWIRAQPIDAWALGPN